VAHAEPRLCQIDIGRELTKEEEPLRLDHDLQRSAANIRTDLDSFSPKEIVTLIRHGYAEASFACRIKQLPIKQPPASVWSPLRDQGPQLSGKQLRIEDARRRRWKLFSGRDIATWLTVVTIIIYFATGYFAARAFIISPRRSVVIIKSETPRTILYISPVRDISSQPFYTEFLQYLIQKSKSSGMDVAVWLPDDDFSGQSQRALLDTAAQQKARYGVVVFTPFVRDPNLDEEALFQFMSRMEGSNVVLFDSDFSDKLRERIWKKGLSIPPCETGDQAEGGERAASALIKYFSAHHLLSPVVAVFDNPSRSGPRSVAFRKALDVYARAEVPPLRPQIIEWTSVQYGRNEAREIAEYAFSKGEKIDGIFSGNDASALGVRDAILYLRSINNRNAAKQVRIVGYDGTFEVRRLLRSSNEDLLLNSVDVGIFDQADKIVWLASQLLQGNHSVFREHRQGCGTYKPHLVR
jgi:ABC-type sugar transport system substrate-binding protein